MKPSSSPVENIVYLLFGGIVFFTAMLFVAEHWYPNDGQLFQTISNLLAGFSGAFLMRVKPPDKDKDPVVMSATTTNSDQPGSTMKTTITKSEPQV